MKSSSAKTLGVVLVVFAVLALVGILRFLIWIPLGVADGVGHGLRSNFLDRDWFRYWAWPWAGLAGFFGLLVLVFWIWIIVWVYKDARKRGLEGVLWGLLVFFLHWIGLIIYLLVRSGRPVIPAAPPAPSAPPDAPKSPVIVVPSQSGAANCPACGQAAQAEWSVCPFCGAKL